MVFAPASRPYDSGVTTPSYGERATWEPAKPRLRPLRVLTSWIVATASLYGAAGILSGIELEAPGGAFLVAALIAVINAVLPPIIAIRAATRNAPPGASSSIPDRIPAAP